MSLLREIGAGGWFAQRAPENDPTTYVWAHNGAAVAGIVLCVFLLALWFDLHLSEKQEDE